jgi:hypothetical protein
MTQSRTRTGSSDVSVSLYNSSSPPDPYAPRQVDRLWIQHPRPKPPRSLKRKRPAAKSKKRAAPAPDPEDDFDGLVEPEPEPESKSKRARGGRREAPALLASPSTGRGSRAAKTQANHKLDAQAKELAELKRQAALEQRQGARSTRAVPPRAPGGTRVSARLYGPEAEAEWQAVPEEWLQGSRKEEKAAERAEASDAESELTQLSASEPEPEPDPEPEPEAKKAPMANGKAKGKAKARSKLRQEVAPEPEPEPEEAEPEWRPPDDWVEWETVCAGDHRAYVGG